MKIMNQFKKYSIYCVLMASVLFTGCKKDDDVAPDEENEEEVITDVKLIFTNNADANDVVEARAKDPDGAGIEELVVLDQINLDNNKTYTLTMEIMNNLTIPGEDIGEEVEEEGHEHRFYFGFTNGAFSNPTGNGNIDNSFQPVVYNDKDINGLPIGLSTTWTTSNSALSGGNFIVRLQHQPDLKTPTSGAFDGDTDINLIFPLKITEVIIRK